MRGEPGVKVVKPQGLDEPVPTFVFAAEKSS